jgi:DNA-binding transcriptional ArsR family regulator
MLDRASAVAYASWFRCLSDATRLQLLHVLATAGQPMAVGELVAETGVGQSTVSAHLRRLADLEFVFIERVGTASLVRVNPDCLAAFPSAAEAVMGLVPVDAAKAPEPPWRGVTRR